VVFWSVAFRFYFAFVDHHSSLSHWFLVYLNGAPIYWTSKKHFIYTSFSLVPHGCGFLFDPVGTFGVYSSVDSFDSFFDSFESVDQSLSHKDRLCRNASQSCGSVDVNLSVPSGQKRWKFVGMILHHLPPTHSI
jgi:hypothetical protein